MMKLVKTSLEKMYVHFCFPPRRKTVSFHFPGQELSHDLLSSRSFFSSESAFRFSVQDPLSHFSLEKEASKEEKQRQSWNY